MSATIKNMEYVFADLLFPDQLMEDDLIEIEDEYGKQIVRVKNIYSIDEGYLVETVNDFGEETDVHFFDDAQIPFYVLMQE